MEGRSPVAEVRCVSSSSSSSSSSAAAATTTTSSYIPSPSLPARRPRTDSVVIISSDEEDVHSSSCPPLDCFVSGSSSNVTGSSSSACAPHDEVTSGMYLTTVQVSAANCDTLRARRLKNTRNAQTTLHNVTQITRVCTTPLIAHSPRAVRRASTMYIPPPPCALRLPAAPLCPRAPHTRPHTCLCVCGRLTLPHAFNDSSWCVSLQDLFQQPRAQQQQQQQQQPCSDALQLCVIGNYMVDLAWLLQQVH
jgi:hypothetical protein